MKSSVRKYLAALATVVLLMLVLFPHHHHEGGAFCVSVQMCQKDGRINDEHTHHCHNLKLEQHHLFLPIGQKILLHSWLMIIWAEALAAMMALVEEPLCAFLPTFGTIIIFIHIFLQLLAQTVLCRPMLHCWLAATPSTGNDAALLLLLYCKNSSFACL